jgi:hypothetical protein
MRKEVGYETLRLIVAVALGAALVVLGVVLAELSGTFTSPQSAGAMVIGIYLGLPLALTVISVGWGGNRATGARKFIVAGIAALLPASALIFGAAEAPWLALLLVVPLVSAFLVIPAVLCFRAAIAVARADTQAASTGTHVVSRLILAPAGVSAAIAMPMALSGLPPCDLCFQSAFALVVLAAYAAPALVAGLLASSARAWVKSHVSAPVDRAGSLVG